MNKILIIFLLICSPCVYSQTTTEKINTIIAASKEKFNSIVEVTLGDELDSPGYATFNFEKSICNFKINEQSLEKSLFTEKLFKFFVYHELSHCHFFSNPFTIFDFSQLNSIQNKMLNDFIFLDALIQTEENINAYNVYHEAYADTRAMAFLLAERYTKEDFKTLHQLRENDFGGEHNTSDSFDDIFNTDWKSMSNESFEKKVNSIASNTTLDSFYKKHFKKYPVSQSLFLDLYKSNVSSVINSYHYNFKSDLEFRQKRIEPLLLNNSIIAKYPIWQAISPYLLQNKIDMKKFFNEITYNLYGFENEQDMVKNSLIIDSFIKN